VWADGLDEIGELIGPRFARSEPRANAVAYLRGLLSAEERKNSWTLSERAGQALPDGMARLLSTTDWDPDALRDDLRSYVLKHLGHPDGVLIVDETGFLKKGQRSAGVARQYSGTAGRIENCQIGVFLTNSTADGRTFLDRCAAAGISDERKFATKPELAITMLTSALDAGVPAKWDRGRRLRPALQAAQDTRRPFGLYVLAVPMNQRVIAKTGLLGTEFRAEELIACLSGRSWRTARPGPAPRATGAPPGPAPASTTRRPCSGCWPADPSRTPLIWPTTSAMDRHGCPWPRWCVLPAPGGRSRKPSRPPRAKPASTITRSDNGPAGTGTSPCPCSPTHS
jgi:hypothetical protein